MKNNKDLSIRQDENIKNPTCIICNMKASIQCQLCEEAFFCSRNHFTHHEIKFHMDKNKSKSKSKLKDANFKSVKSIVIKDAIPKVDEDYDLKQLFEQTHQLKKESEVKFSEGKYVECIFLINKTLSLSKKFYQDDHLFIIDLIFLLAESYVNIGNLEESIYNLENLLDMTNQSKSQISVATFRNKAYLLIGSASINIGDYTKALKAYESAEKECLKVFIEPELNLKIAAIKLNIGICYIYLNNFSIAEKILRKGQKQIEGLLGNDIVYRLNADFNENLTLIHENNNKNKEAISFYKKSLKTKFSLYGDENDEVLELQYKISSAFMSLKMYKEAEEILVSIINVLNNGRLKESYVENFYRYGTYFYMAGVVSLKLVKKDQAKDYLKKSQVLWKDILNHGDPCLTSVSSLLKLCNNVSTNKSFKN